MTTLRREASSTVSSSHCRRLPEHEEKLEAVPQGRDDFDKNRQSSGRGWNYRKGSKHICYAQDSVSQGNIKVWMRGTAEMGLIDHLLLHPHRRLTRNTSQQQDNSRASQVELRNSESALPHSPMCMTPLPSLYSEEDPFSTQLSALTPRVNSSTPFLSNFPSPVVFTRIPSVLIKYQKTHLKKSFMNIGQGSRGLLRNGVVMWTADNHTMRWQGFSPCLPLTS